jgi:hypothetical protein
VHHFGHLTFVMPLMPDNTRKYESKTAPEAP